MSYDPDGRHQVQLLKAEVVMAAERLGNLAEAYRQSVDRLTAPNPKPTVLSLLGAPTFRAGVDYIRFDKGDPHLLGTNPQWGEIWEIEESEATPGFEPGRWRPAIFDLDMEAELVPAANYRDPPVSP